MSSTDSIDVTLALVDPTLLSSWEGMVKRGEECSLLLKHSKGKITATLQCMTPTTPSSSTSSPSSSAKKRKKSKGSKEKRLKALLDYHQRLVVEKGLPPSRLMEQHAAASTTDHSSPAQSSGPEEKQFQCDQCDFSSESQRGLKVHVGRSHKNPSRRTGGRFSQPLTTKWCKGRWHFINQCWPLFNGNWPGSPTLLWSKSNKARRKWRSICVCLRWLLSPLENKEGSSKLFMLNPSQLFTLLSLCQCCKQFLIAWWPEGQFDRGGPVDKVVISTIFTVLPCHPTKIYLLTY